ncbi:MAG: glycosyltransferase [Candidatus Muirbacterium halophilum]|nr:glycosyltransferase [Candidatus Muirbacterium halophilum]MCK9474372.1 glycosyltransferase [Candidatus Muirbacterium halophilum]
MNKLDLYRDIVGNPIIDSLYQLAAPLKGINVVHVNSTKVGGGVAEILHKLIPLKEELGINTKWEVVTGEQEFYNCTKNFHNGLQGNVVSMNKKLLDIYEKTNEENADKLRNSLKDADVVFIHDPQPAMLLKYIPERKGKWIWRCHIDVSKPYRPLWNYIKNKVADYDASVFSLADYAQKLPHTQYLILPSIDPLSEKNIDLDIKEVKQTCISYGIDLSRPIMSQISRFDRFKDPIGVIKAYKIVKKFTPDLQLVLAGGGATDDPEGEAVLNEVREAAYGDSDIKILLLPADAHRTINAIQRGSDIILQKSVKEGFGLTVTEGMWKGKPMIGGDTGGIRLQVINHHTGYLVNTPEGAALRIRYLFNHKKRMLEIGKNAKEFVRENFLITRHLREYLTLMLAAIHYQDKDRIEL